MEQRQKKNKNQADLDQHFVYKMYKHHLIVKIAEIALFVSLFVLSASLAMAAPVTAENVGSLINKERSSRGLTPLNVDRSLNQAAFEKSTNMLSRNYFEHYAFGLTPWVFIKNQNYDYLYAGENLAMDFNTSEGMVSAWMTSPTHRKNILNPDFSDMGVGAVKGEFKDSTGERETTIVTNMFATRRPAVIRLFDNVVEKLKNIF